MQYSTRSLSTSSNSLALGLLIICACVMGFILFYVFSLRKVPMYKMRRKMIFNMIYDDFKTEDGSRFSLLFYLFFFLKRIIYAIVLVFLSDKNIILGPIRCLYWNMKVFSNEILIRLR
jgi:hypothetical protein